MDITMYILTPSIIHVLVPPIKHNLKMKFWHRALVEMITESRAIFTHPSVVAVA